MSAAGDQGDRQVKRAIIWRWRCEMASGWRGRGVTFFSPEGYRKRELDVACSKQGKTKGNGECLQREGSYVF